MPLKIVIFKGGDRNVKTNFMIHFPYLLEI